MKNLKTYNELYESSYVIKLDYYNQNLTELPELPSKLEILYCNVNDLKELPKLPYSLEYLYCGDNYLKELPELPSGLRWLDCPNNNLEELPELPLSLEGLYCSDNDLPYTNLEKYKEWIEQDPDLSLKEKYLKWKTKSTQNKFNI